MSFDGGQERIMMKANVATYNIPESSKEYLQTANKLRVFIRSTNLVWHWILLSDE
jgi:hypothetical protein